MSSTLAACRSLAVRARASKRFWRRRVASCSSRMASHSPCWRAPASGFWVSSRKPRAMPCRPSSCSRSRVGWSSIELSSVEVARTADVGVHDYGLLGSRRTGTAIEVMGEDRGDALVVERADFDGAASDPFGAGRIDAAQQPHDTQTSTEALFGMRPAGEDGDDQSFGARANTPPPALEALRRPLGITTMGAGHVLGIGAVEPAAIAPGMSGDTLAAVEHLDGVCGDADVDLLADQGVRHRIEEALDLDVVIKADAGQPPFAVDVFRNRQRLQRRTLDRFEQLAPADPEATHRALVHPGQHLLDRGVALGEREEGRVAQAAENIGLGEANSRFNFGLIARSARSCRQDADLVMRRHPRVAAVDLRVVE